MTHREKIVEHVSQMITSLGVKSVRMDDVASEMGMSKRTLYEMFGGKEELLYESMVHWVDSRCKDLSQKCSHCQNMMEVLLVSVMELCGNGVSSDLERRLTYNLKKFYPAVYERVQRYHYETGLANLKTALDRCSAEGLLDPNAKIDLMAQLFLMTVGVYMSTSEEVLLPKDVSREEAFVVMTINFLRGVASIKGLEVIDEILARNAALNENE